MQDFDQPAGVIYPTNSSPARRGAPHIEALPSGWARRALELFE
jgi:hypothetical protein